MNFPRVGLRKPRYGGLRWAFPLKYSFLARYLYPHRLSLSILAQWLLRNARFCKVLKRRIIGFKTNYLRTELD
jgi:hypothetical protein